MMKQPRAYAAGSPLLVTALAITALAAHAGPNDIPDSLRVPAGQVLALSAHGVGVQIYACTAAKDDPGHFSWTLTAPEAELQDASGKHLGKHYAGPTWEAGDGSKVIGEVAAKADAPDAAAIPWLLLRAKSTSGAGIFTPVVSIQRLYTDGGKAPATVCSAQQSASEVRVAYSAEYRFYTVAP